MIRGSQESMSVARFGGNSSGNSAACDALLFEESDRGAPLRKWVSHQVRRWLQSLLRSHRH
jgi:hypothetical protein